MKAYKKIILILALSCFSTDLYKACASGDDTAVSGGALRIIQRFENFSPSVYDDSAGNPTIGYGHLITADEDYTDVELSEDEARTLLVTDMREKSNISDYLTVDLEYYQRDALISLCFNIGIGNFSKSTLLQKVNAGETTGAYEYFGHWRKAGGSISHGLIKRRFAELCIFAGLALDSSDDTIPSEQWGIDPMPITDENWGSISEDLREEAVKIYKDYASE